MYPLPVALQLYSIRETLAKNFEAGVREVASMGYVGVEPAGFQGTTPQAAGRLFRELGLAVPSAHSTLPIGDKKKQVLDTMAAIGCKRIVAGSLPEALFQSLEGIYEAADRLNAAAAVAREHGMAVGYHNHRQEFTLVEGRPAYEHMLPRLDPDVLWEVDTYWAKVAEHDPAEVIAKLGPRAKLLHIKDGPGTVRDPMTAVGDGVMNWPHVMAAGKAHGEWLIVEIDNTAGDMMKAVEKSYRYLADKGWGHGAAHSRA
jgi:sugar phosphate isomerase/epimerase